MAMILINIGRQSDGCTYQLHPRSSDEIRSRFPHARPVPSVFIGYEAQAEFEALHGPNWRQVALMLTGLSCEQIEAMGGARLYDPVAEQEVALIE